ncbi:uncharacterized protein LOC122850133 [Aphidius gifuensis]|uniref:uncharacterized protein LOC122850133 n=1 Tax=Aphidius gifuensis TaxID=684658 RepID=UPI001CDC842D|nr:uncharacterized protein LOC122850133 [Aphidius gifuensis]
MPNFVRRCDPIKQQKDVTYAGFDNLVYAFVTNQQTFEPKNRETCKKFCGEIITSTPECEKKNNCRKYETICSGKITGCRGDASYEVCPRQKNDNSSARNYHWIKNKDNNIYYGNANKACTSMKSIETKSIITWLPYQMSWLPSFALTNCRSCICQCVDDRIDTNSQKIRGFSYMWSNTSDDMVATGARLVAQDRMIHIQLREAKLLPLGKINVTSERWVPLPKFKYQNNFPSVAIYPDGTQISLKEGRDFGVAKFIHTKICLQTLKIDDEYLLSAVRFNDFGFIKSKNCISLDAKFVKFNYSSGNISSDVYQWAPPLRQPPQLTELIINQPDDPLKFKTNLQDSMNNQYIKIGVTDLIKDASQTTIPFFDLQEVTTKPSAPISAIELIHKGHGSSGGFISLKIHLINLSFFMDLQPSPKTTIEQTSYLNNNNTIL